MKTPPCLGSRFTVRLRRSHRLQTLVYALLTPSLLVWNQPLQANPHGGVVVHGDVQIGAGAGGNLQILQGSQNAIIDWQGFSISAGELTQFLQPGSSSAVLNRVTGGDPSAIHGALQANGNVFLINPSGILVGPSGSIDVHGLVLSTLDVDNGEFLARGDMVFKGGSDKGVTNLGRISAIGGDVFLIGRTITNSGSVKASQGRVGLAAGEEVLLKADTGLEGERVFVRAKGAGASGTGILNDGTIEGAAVELKAHGNLYALAINNKGSIRATGATHSGGRVFLRGAGGSISNSGSIRATGGGIGSGGRVLIEAAYAKVDGQIKAEGGHVRIAATEKTDLGGSIDVSTSAQSTGGSIIVEAREIAVGSTAAIDASGTTGGGNIQIGGGFQGRDASIRNAESLVIDDGATIRADALASGAGGNVILWSDGDTAFSGAVSARGVSQGGFAEISGKQNLGFDGLVDLTAINGPAGTLLLDPTNVTIGIGTASASHINNAALSNTLDSGVNVIISTNFGTGQRGDITIQPGVATALGQNAGGIEWYQDSAGTPGGTLTLLATGNILFANDVRTAGSGGINIVAGWDGFTGLVDPIAAAQSNNTYTLPPGGFDMDAVLATINDGIEGNDAAGLNGGSVFIGGYDINGNVANINEGIEVGSRYGATRVAAHDLLIRGSNGGQRWAQLGFRDSGAEFNLNGTTTLATQNGERNEWWGSNGAANGSNPTQGLVYNANGTVAGGTTTLQTGNILGKNYIALLGGTVESGGDFRGAGYGATGAIEINVSGRLDLRGGNSGNAAAQIGHGGLSAEGVEPNRNVNGLPAGALTTRDGAVIDVGENNRAFFGATWRTNYAGNAARVDAPITIKVGEDILAMAPSDFESVAGYTDLTNDEGNGNRYVKIGHGGLDNFGSYHGDISVIALGATTAADNRGLAGAGIQLRGGMGSLNIAQIGHGGFHEGNYRTIWDQTSSGSVTVRAETGAVRLLGFNLLPRTGNVNMGDYVDVNTALAAGSANDTEYEFGNVQIGHGGWHRNRVATGSFTAPGGAAVSNILPDQSMNGRIEVYAGGTVQVRDNMGYDENGNWTADLGPGVDPILLSGGILRDVGIEVRAGNGTWSYGQIGHGGVNMNSNTTGTIHGDIDVRAAAGTVLFVGGEEKRSQRTWGVTGNYVMVGHGGYDADAMTGGFQGKITVLAGQGGTNALGQTRTPLDGDIIFRTGRMGESWAQIGHGGRSSSGNIVGVSDIVVKARDGIEFTGRISGPSDAWLSTDYVLNNVDAVNTSTSAISSQNNYVGQNVVAVDADTRPQANTQGNSWNVDIKHAQIGHGGYDFLVDNQPTQNFTDGDTIDVDAQGGPLRFTSSNANYDYIMIGMGGVDFANQRNIKDATITVKAAGDIWFDARNASSMEYNRVPIGNGSAGLEATPQSRGTRAFAMIGNGGYDVDGDFSGDVTVQTTNGGNLYMFGPVAQAVKTVNGFVGGTVEGPVQINAATGNIGSVVGKPHLLTSLQEATMKERSFTLYHGNDGASPTDFRGNIVPGSFGIDLYDDADSSALPDVVDNAALHPDPNKGYLVVNQDALAGSNGTLAVGAIVGEIDYTTGVVTIWERVESRDDIVNRGVTYNYLLNGVTSTNIAGERTPESDSATRASQAYLGHGGIVPGTVSIVIDPDNTGGGRQVISDWFGNGVLYNEGHVRVGQIDYNSGRVIIEGINTATGDTAPADGGWDIGTELQKRAPLNNRTNPDAVIANYQYTEGNPDNAFVQIGNGGYSAALGGIYSAGHTGEIVVNVEGDIRLHGGAYSSNYAQIGHGGRDSQGWHGYQTDQGLANRANPDFAAIDANKKGNITVTAGGIVEMLAGRGVSYWDTTQYAQIGHGGYNADGNHQGNIRVTAGTGEISSTTGVIGGSGEYAGIVFTAGQTKDAYAQLGHGGDQAQALRNTGEDGARGFYGHITVNSVGSILFTSGTSLNNYQDLDDGRISSQLGHGGYDADNSNVTWSSSTLIGKGIGHAGDIYVSSSGGSIVFQAGDEGKAAPGGAFLGEGFGILHPTQLGHGGYAASGDHHGNITVIAANDIQFFGGSRTRDDSTDKRNYGILGHGGDDSDGYMGARDANDDPLDTISVTAISGNIDFVAGEGRRNWVQLGNGGMLSNGDHVANILVNAGGSINFLGGQGGADSILDSSRTLDIATWAAGTDGGGWTALRYRDIRFWNSGVAAAGLNFTITVNGRNYVATRATVQEANNNSSFTTANIVSQSAVTLEDGSTVAANEVVGEINLRTGHVRFFRDLDPNAIGSVTASYVTGSATSINVSATSENSTINPMLAQAVRGTKNVAPALSATFNNSRGGITNISEAFEATYNDNIGIAAGTFRLVVPGGGAVIEDDGVGNLRVVSAGDSGLAVGNSVGTIDYLYGQIVLTDAINPNARNGVRAYYDVDRPIGSDLSYAQLGNGGAGTRHTPSGQNEVADKSNVGNIILTAGGDVRFHAGNGSDAYTQLGHGGGYYDTSNPARGANSGDITLTAGGVVEFFSGRGVDETDVRAYAQLGHGGYDADGNHFGNITITSGSGAGTTEAGYGKLATLGDAIGSSMGLFFKAGSRQDNYAQLGHGGRSSRSGAGEGALAFGLNGDITINTVGDIAFVAGTGTLDSWGDLGRDDIRNWALLGHGGYDSDPTPGGGVTFGQTSATPLPAGTAGAGLGNWGHFGDIYVRTTQGNISVLGGSTIPVANRYDLDGNPLPISADPYGLLVSAGDGYGIYHSAQIGHGGYGTSGDHHGNITTIADLGNIHVLGGMMSNDNSAEKRNSAQIGHGGAEAQGHLGRTGETIKVQAGRDIVVAAGQGNRNQALIGNGGLNYDGSHTGTIQVYAARDIHLRGGVAAERVVRRIGEYQDMTGADGGAANDLSEFNAYYGSGGLGYLMMDAAAAAGGGQKTKLMGKDIQPGTVQFRLAEGAALFNAARTPDYIDDGLGNIVQTSNSSNIVGTIDYATGEIAWTTAILASNTANQPDLFVDYDHRTGIRNDAIYANATIGHGGYATGSRVEALPGGGTNRGISGDIDVRAGVNAAGAFNGSVGSVVAVAGNDQRTYVQIGHGGMDSGTPAGHALSGAIGVRADGNIDFRGGGGLVDNQHIAFNYYGTGSSTVASVTTASDADRTNPRYATPLGSGTQSMSGISDIVYAFAHIGHGGVSSHANNGVDNNVNNPLAPTNDPATGHNGNIYVQTAAGDIRFTGGGDGGFHFAQIGHGGTSSLGNHFGRIDVISGRDIVFTGGGAAYRGTTNADKGSYAMIGHGGRSLTGNLSGLIHVDATGAIRFSGGDGLSDRAKVPYSAHVYVLNRAGDQDENHYNRSESRQNDAQIGHGGFFVYGDKTGDIEVTAGGGIDFRGGDRLAGSLDNNSGYTNYAQIGHGGIQAWRQIRTNLAMPNAGNAVAPNADDWNLPFRWDAANNRYVLDGTGQFPWPIDNSIDPVLGLGNPLYDGFSGDITVTATGGDIRFSGGTSSAAFAQIGHGGIEAGGDHYGEIKVEAQNGDIIFTANRIEETGSTSTGTNTYVQIGHGGSFSSGEQSGKIGVKASGEIRFKAGRHDSYAMVGHGGRESTGTTTTQWGSNYRHSANFLYSRNTMYRPGTRSGDIEVLAGGNIAFTGGNLNGDRSFVQIGHGGYNVAANPDPDSKFGDGHNGEITVKSTDGGIRMQAGQAQYAYAMIGHGGVFSFGNHGGDGANIGAGDNRTDSDILVEAATGIDMIAMGRFSTNTTAANFAQIGHGGRQSSFRDVHDITGNNDNYAKLQPIAGGTGYTNPETGLANVDNPGQHPLAPYTNNNDGLYMGSVLATLGTFMGDITVRTTGTGADIRFIGPNEADGTLGIRGVDSYVQLGHGGFRNFGDIEGDITVDSMGGIQFIALQGASSITNNDLNHAAYALLGHGGYESGGSFNGDITVTARGDVLFQGADSPNSANLGFAQLGHGGYDSSKAGGQYREAIRNPTSLNPAEPAPDAVNIAAGLKPVGNGGKITVNVLNGGNLEFLAGRDAQTYVQLGHGGRSTRDSHSGDIEVHVSGGIRFLASVDGLGLAGDNWGNNDDGYAQLGHGGHASSGSHSGNITVTAGTFADGLNEGRSIVFRGGNDSNTYAQLGHGGRDTVSYGTGADAVGLSGDISVTAASDILFVAGTVGGRDLWDNTGGGNYVQLGHGGYNSDTEVNRASVTGLFGPDGKPVGHSGNITVVSGGSVEFLAGDTNRAYEPSVGENGGTFHYAQIGHGGYSSYGNHYGDITVRAGMQPDYTVTNANARVYFAGGVVATSQWADQNSYAQLGHGGREAFGNMGLRTADDSALDTIKVLSGGDIVFTAAASGVNSYVTLGNGGYQARGDHAANIEAYAGADILFEGGQLPLTPTLATGAYGRYSWAGTDANAQTRSLDWAANLHTGTANPGAVNGVAGRVNINFSRVVNGSIVITIRDTTLAVVGRLVQVGNYLVAENDITANFGTGVETILAGTQVAAIGNGGVLDNGASATGTTHITFLRDVNPGANDGTANLALEFVHGVGERAYAQLGNGGYEADNVNGVIDRGNNGTINVTSVGGNIDFLGGSQSLTSAQLGHGGYLNFGHNDGDIAVRALDGGVNFASGTNTSFVQLGHGGRDAQGNHSGNILVEALGAGGVRFTSGLVANAAEVYAQLGHGGRAARGDHSGNIVVRSRDDIVFTGGSGAQNYVQLGHGGYDSDNPNDNTTLGNTGSISVASTAGDLIFQAGNANNTYAHLGHGGGANKGANTGDIVARAAGSVVVKGGSGTQAYAQVGHGGYDADGDHGVNALVSSDVIVSAGSGALGTHLGTGLFDDLGDIDGIAGADTVQFAPVPTGKGKVEVSGGTGTDTYAMVGHGGRSAGNTAGSASTMNGKVGVEAYGDIVLQGGTGTRGFVQVGHGGWEDAMNMALSGDISVVSRTGRLDVLAGNGSEAYSLVGHGTLRNAVANGPSGSRSGFVYVEVGSWHIAPVGTTSLARIGHRSNATNNGVSTADRFTLLGTGSDGTTSHTVDAALWALIGAADHVSAGGDATFGGVDLTMDQAISGNSAGKINLLATGNLDVRKSVQNSGTGAVSVVAGWDGHTGMSGGLPSGELDFLAHVPMRIFDIAPVIATDASWGNNGGVATVGGGAQTTGVAVGSARGATTVLGDAVKVIGSNTATNGYALVGAVPVVGVSPTGAIVVKAREGGVAVEGGNAALTYAQIGHRALGTVIPALSGNILVDSLGSLTLKGGVGLLSSAQIGHGANSATANIGGTVTVKVANDIDAVGGSGGGAYSQIGHGGLFTKGNLHDGIKVDAGGNVRLSAPNLAVNSYAKIGHGDDVRGTSASLGGTGDRAGNIELTSGESIEMQSALVGHVNGDSSATPVAGSHTWIALVDENGELLIDPSAGNLIADATSEFSGADEVRLYVPRRANNQVAAGAKINGFAYDGGVDDPQLVQRPDEYTNHWIDGENGTSGTLGQRDTLLGSGPDPVVSAGYAFYYDLIEIGTPPPVVPTDPGAGGNSGGGSAGGGGQAVQRATDYRRLVPDDRTRDEWRRKQEREYSRWGDYGIYYEGYSQYGLHGESVYDWKKEKAEEEGAED